MSKVIKVNWDWDRKNNERLKLIKLENLLSKKGVLSEDYNGVLAYIHKGYEWKFYYKSNCNQWNDGRTGNWCSIHITKIRSLRND